MRQDFCSSSTTEPQHSHSHSNFSWTILSKGIVRCNEINPTGADLHVGGGGLGGLIEPPNKIKIANAKTFKSIKETKSF